MKYLCNYVQRSSNNFSIPTVSSSFPNISNIEYYNCSVPGAISKFNSSSITIKESSNNTNVLDTILTWGLPCSLNGELEFFNVSGFGIRDGYPPDIIFEIHNCTDYSHNDHMCSINLNELKGEYNYNFTISTKVKDVDTLGWSTSQNVPYPAGSKYQSE